MFVESAVVPDGFEKVSSYIFLVDGDEHAQEGFYHEETKELLKSLSRWVKLSQILVQDKNF